MNCGTTLHEKVLLYKPKTLTDAAQYALFSEAAVRVAQGQNKANPSSVSAVNSKKSITEYLILAVAVINHGALLIIKIVAAVLAVAVVHIGATIAQDMDMWPRIARHRYRMRDQLQLVVGSKVATAVCMA